MIPEFPHSREITLHDKPIFDSIFTANPPEISAYTFSNIFAWRGAYNASVSRLGSHVLVLCDLGDHVACLQPLGEGPIAPVAEDMFRLTDRPLTFERISIAPARELADLGLIVESDRDNWDYLYSAKDLIDLAGRKYDGKRNFIARAREAIDYEYVKLDGRTAIECEDFAEYWCQERKCETVEGLRREKCAVYELLANFEALGIVGGAIRANGAIAAFSLGESLNPETFVIHVEKADSRIDGLYQLINHEFCKAEAAGSTYVNREQDLGVPGLRKAKESYHPVRMIETFHVRKP